MKLYIKQLAFNGSESFPIMDENGQTKYFAQGEFYSRGKKIRVFNLSGFEVCTVRQKPSCVNQKYVVSVGGMQLAEITREMLFLHPELDISGLDWEVIQQGGMHEYSINRSGRHIVTVHSKLMEYGPSVEADISPNANEIAVLGVVLAIDLLLYSAPNIGFLVVGG